MLFAKFTRVLPADTLGYVNPTNVVAVDTFGSYTRIHTTAAETESAGPGHIIGVMEPIETVVSQLQLAAG